MKSGINLAQKYDGTEQGAVKKEYEENSWQKEYGEKLPYFVEKMDLLLADGGKAAILKLKSMFLIDNIFKHYIQTNEFARMYVVMSIYEMEEAAGIKKTILNQGSTVEELSDVLFRMKTILYRLDFGIGSGVEDELLFFLKEHSTSTVMLEMMVTSSAMRPLNLALKLQKIFAEAHWEDYEISILCFIEKYWKGNYRVCYKLHQYGKISIDSALERMAEKETEVVFELQEFMWKLFYKEPESEKKIAYYLKNNKVADELWIFLLEHDEVKAAEYYFLIINALLEAGLFHKTELVLEFMLSKNLEVESAGYILERIRDVRFRLENNG